MFKVISNILLFALAIGLTIFTGTRTLDLLMQWLPANQSLMAYLGLGAFEGGLYFWSFFFVSGAKGAIQRGIALMMVVVCFASVAVATVSDLMLDGAESGKLPVIPANQEQAIVVVVGIVIVLNVAAFLAAKLTHPDKLREMAVQDAEDLIHAEELHAIRSVAPHVAVRLAPIKTEQWVDQTWNRLLPGATRPSGLVSGSTSPTSYVEEKAAYQLPAPRQETRALAQEAQVQQPVEEKRGDLVEGLKRLFGKHKAEDLAATYDRIAQDMATREAQKRDETVKQRQMESGEVTVHVPERVPRGFMPGPTQQATKEPKPDRKRARRARLRAKRREQGGGPVAGQSFPPGQPKE